MWQTRQDYLYMKLIRGKISINPLVNSREQVRRSNETHFEGEWNENSDRNLSQVQGRGYSINCCYRSHANAQIDAHIAHCRNPTAKNIEYHHTQQKILDFNKNRFYFIIEWIEESSTSLNKTKRFTIMWKLKQRAKNKNSQSHWWTLPVCS